VIFLPLLVLHGERVGVRGRGILPLWSNRPPLTLTLSPRKSGERGYARCPRKGKHPLFHALGEEVSAFGVGCD
jgi:hypothetical protein